MVLQGGVGGQERSAEQSREPARDDESSALRALAVPLLCWHESLRSARTDPLVALAEDAAFIATDRPLPVGTTVFLELALGHASNAARAQIDAVVVSAEAPVDLTGFVVRFIDVDSAVRTWMQHYLESAAQRRSVAKPAAPASLPAPESAAPSARPEAAAERSLLLGAPPPPARAPLADPSFALPAAGGMDPFLPAAEAAAKALDEAAGLGAELQQPEPDASLEAADASEDLPELSDFEEISSGFEALDDSFDPAFEPSFDPGFDPAPTERQPAEPSTAEPSPAEPLSAEPPPAEPLSAEPPPAEPLSAEPPPAEPLSAEPPPAEPLTAELLTAELMPAPPGAQPPKAPPPETRQPEVQAPELQPSELQPSELQPSEPTVAPQIAEPEAGGVTSTELPIPEPPPPEEAAIPPAIRFETAPPAALAEPTLADAPLPSLDAEVEEALGDFAADGALGEGLGDDLPSLGGPPSALSGDPFDPFADALPASPPPEDAAAPLTSDAFVAPREPPPSADHDLQDSFDDDFGRGFGAADGEGEPAAAFDRSLDEGLRLGLNEPTRDLPGDAFGRRSEPPPPPSAFVPAAAERPPAFVEEPSPFAPIEAPAAPIRKATPEGVTPIFGTRPPSGLFRPPAPPPASPPAVSTQSTPEAPRDQTAPYAVAPGPAPGPSAPSAPGVPPAFGSAIPPASPVPPTAAPAPPTAAPAPPWTPGASTAPPWAPAASAASPPPPVHPPRPVPGPPAGPPAEDAPGFASTQRFGVASSEAPASGPPFGAAPFGGPPGLSPPGGPALEQTERYRLDASPPAPPAGAAHPPPPTRTPTLELPQPPPSAPPAPPFGHAPAPEEGPPAAASQSGAHALFPEGTAAPFADPFTALDEVDAPLPPPAPPSEPWQVVSGPLDPEPEPEPLLLDDELPVVTGVTVQEGEEELPLVPTRTLDDDGADPFQEPWVVGGPGRGPPKGSSEG